MKVKYLVGIILLTSISCKKLLDEKSNKKLSTIGTLKDLQYLLNDPYMFRRGSNIANTSSDEYYMLKEDLELFTEIGQDGYIWAAGLNDLDDWRDQYNTIFAMNNVLDNLDVPGTQSDIDVVKGSALFIRAQSFYVLSQLYAKQYDSATAATDWGIVLRLNSNFNIPSTRSTIKETYDQMINDLITATSLLPPSSTLKSKPSKAACYGLLSRIYLQVGNYAKAREAAVSCLKITNQLLDFNNASSVDVTSSNPFPKFEVNPEIIFLMIAEGPINTSTRASVDTALIKLYGDDDLRKKAYLMDKFDGSFSFKGSYTPDFGHFNGISTSELYLILSECAARLGDVQVALQNLNTLLSNRIDKTSFVPISSSNTEEILKLILAERRKELVYRGLRWPDLRRLNKENKFAVSLTRKLNQSTYTLPPNDLRYTLLVPREILQNASILQNPR